MKKEEIDRIAQNITNIKNSLRELDEARKKKDSAALNEAKRKILNFQIQIDRAT